ncbi:hypothetical protein GGI26_000176 [Coemansia sp. RSA 1358]|nr:lysozyme-like domain-containing protein [Coemansia spiralis]KAJ2626092.1 hypothetical protein GGI26_000176 [Coemansia sp. RSA 1358]
MVSLTNFASLLAIALTTSLLSNAVPDAQSQAESSAVQPSLGAGSASSEVQGSGVASGASENASSGVVATAANESTDAGADESAADTANESANDSSSSGDESSGGGDSGSNYGITCESFNQAVAGASKAISQNYPTPTSAQCNAFLKGMKSQGGIASAREAAMFLANILWESDGLRAKQEYDCVQNPEQCAQTYKTPEDVPGQTYWGRGYIQLTWHYNYEDASKGLYGDNRLATDADQVATNEETAWGVSFWFWKANVRSDPGVQAGEFGASVNKINGALECKGSAQDKAKKRYAMYQAILKVFAPHETPNEKGCYN